jgi:hypothetical protein
MKSVRYSLHTPPRCIEGPLEIFRTPREQQITLEISSIWRNCTFEISLGVACCCFSDQFKSHGCSLRHLLSAVGIEPSEPRTSKWGEAARLHRQEARVCVTQARQKGLRLRAWSGQVPERLPVPHTLGARRAVQGCGSQPLPHHISTSSLQRRDPTMPPLRLTLPLPPLACADTAISAQYLHSLESQKLLQNRKLTCQHMPRQYYCSRSSPKVVLVSAKVLQLSC